MKVLSIQDVLDARAAIADRGLACTLHLHDACGRQTLSLEAGADAPQETLPQTRELLVELFAARGVTIEFNGRDDTVFYVV